ncbi:MAG TPA: WhiB family transcriptional regulator [Tetrasphaera sp.]|nr:WhiB family transcriptional regulator [Tetrasphaera sp.]
MSVLAPIEIGQGPQNWAAQGACATADPDELFVRGKAQHDAKLVCRSCPVSLQCLADALDNRVEFGVWGGLTERERRALLRQRPDVTSWQAALLKPRSPAARTA